MDWNLLALVHAMLEGEMNRLFVEWKAVGGSENAREKYEREERREERREKREGGRGKGERGDAEVHALHKDQERTPSLLSSYPKQSFSPDSS